MVVKFSASSMPRVLLNGALVKVAAVKLWPPVIRATSGCRGSLPPSARDAACVFRSTDPETTSNSKATSLEKSQAIREKWVVSSVQF